MQGPWAGLLEGREESEDETGEKEEGELETEEGKEDGKSADEKYGLDRVIWEKKEWTDWKKWSQIWSWLDRIQVGFIPCRKG